MGQSRSDASQQTVAYSITSLASNWMEFRGAARPSALQVDCSCRHQCALIRAHSARHGADGHSAGPRPQCRRRAATCSMKVTALLEFSGSAVSMTTEADHQSMRSASSSSGFGALGCLEQLALAWKPLLDARQVFVLGFVVADGRMLLKPPPGPRPRPWRAAVEQPRLGIQRNIAH